MSYVICHMTEFNTVDFVIFSTWWEGLLSCLTTKTSSVLITIQHLFGLLFINCIVFEPLTPVYFETRNKYSSSLSKKYKYAEYLAEFSNLPQSKTLF